MIILILCVKKKIKRGDWNARDGYHDNEFYMDDNYEDDHDIRVWVDLFYKEKPYT